MRRFPFVVYGIIALNVYVFAQELAAQNTDAYIDALAAIPFNVVHAIALGPPGPPVALLTLVTSMFVHGSVLHIFFNMLFFYAFGPDIEYLCGHLRFALLYLLCGIAGGAAMIAVGPGSHVPEIGASGAIAGILGAYMVSFPRATIVRLPAFVVIGIWAIVQFVHGFGALSQNVSSEHGGTAYFAHIGGFCAGVLTIGLLRVRTPSLGRSRSR